MAQSNLSTASGRDPFQDPSLLPSSNATSASASGHEDDDPTLIVGRDASLTLGTDSLIVLGQSSVTSDPRASTDRAQDDAIPVQPSALRSCCGLISTTARGSPTRSIAYHNILWASLNEFDLTIHHAHPISARDVRPACVAYPVDKTERTRTQQWLDRLLDLAYGKAQRMKRIKVLVNPFSGKGTGRKYWTRDIHPIFAAAQCVLDVQETTHKEHAIEIAEKLDVDNYDVIASCSGDGLPHEVFNGLARKRDAVRALGSVAVVQLPCGSGNAMSLNLNGTDSPSLAALAIVKGVRTPIDLMSVTQGAKRFLSFLSQSTGMVASTDLGTEHLRWMGDLRFTYGFLTRLILNAQYPCDISYKLISDSKADIRERCRAHMQSPSNTVSASIDNDSSEEAPQDGLPPLRHGTINDPLPASWTPLTAYDTMGTFYAGKMPLMARDSTFFPAALPDDGAVDIALFDAAESRWKAVASFFAIADGSLFDLAHIRYYKVEAFRVIPRPGGGRAAVFSRLLGRKPRQNAKHDGYISIDGERVPFEGFQVEIHRGLGTVLSRNGRTYEVPPLK